jgi:hypothetical protein
LARTPAADIILPKACALPLGATQSSADVGRVVTNAVKDLVKAEPNVRFVDILPFSAPDTAPARPP